MIFKISLDLVGKGDVLQHQTSQSAQINGSIFIAFLNILIRKNCRRKNPKVSIERRDQGLAVEDKEIEFPIKIIRFKYGRKKIRQIDFEQKIIKNGVPMFATLKLIEAIKIW